MKYDVLTYRLNLPLVHEGYNFWANDFVGVDEEYVPLTEELCNRNGSINPVAEVGKALIGQSRHTVAALFTCLVELVTKKLSDPEGQRAMRSLRIKLQRQFDELLGDNGVFFFPTHPTVAPYNYQPLFQWVNCAYTVLFNSLALPATHIPMGLNDRGIPTGIQVAAKRYNDHLTVAIACELEKAFGGYVKPS